MTAATAAGAERGKHRFSQIEDGSRRDRRVGLGAAWLPPIVFVGMEACGLTVASSLVIAFAALIFGGAVTRLARSAWISSASVTSALALPLVVSAFDLGQILILVIGALGLVVVSGYTGQISVAQGSFVGVGAYVTAVLGSRHDLPLLATLPIDVIAGALAGLVVGIPSARLRGIYQVMTTLAVGVAFPPVIVQIGNVVGGSSGLIVAPLDAASPKFGAGPRIDATLQAYFVCLACGLIVWALLTRITRSHHGTAMRAIRQNEIVAAINGVPVTRYRISAFMVSASIAALAGGLSAITIGAVSPESFGLLYSIQFLVIIAVGGTDGLGGAVVGAVAVFLITTDIQGIHVPHTNYIVSDEVVYGLGVVVVLLLFRGGLFGAGSRALSSCERRCTGRILRQYRRIMREPANR